MQHVLDECTLKVMLNFPGLEASCVLRADGHQLHHDVVSEGVVELSRSESLLRAAGPRLHQDVDGDDLSLHLIQ